MEEGLNALSKRKKIIYTAVIAAFAIVIAIMAWGKTWRVAWANRLFAANQLDRALTVYQQLLNQEPNSPIILNNLGLCLYQQGKYDAAAGYFRKACQSGVNHQNQVGQLPLLNNIHYNLGNALFKLADQEQSGQAANLFNEALSNYRQAIEAERSDRDAKYNYELTRLRAERAQQQPNRQEQQSNHKQQDQEDQKDQSIRKQGQTPQDSQEKQGHQGKTKEQSKQKQQENQGKNQTGQAKQGRPSGQRVPEKTSNRRMSKAEAEALLKAAENGEQYHSPVIIADPPAGNKDW